MRHHTYVVTAIELVSSARQAIATDWALMDITLQMMIITSFYKSHISLYIYTTFTEYFKEKLLDFTIIVI